MSGAEGALASADWRARLKAVCAASTRCCAQRRAPPPALLAEFAALMLPQQPLQLQTATVIVELQDVLLGSDAVYGARQSGPNAAALLASPDLCRCAAEASAVTVAYCLPRPHASTRASP